MDKWIHNVVANNVGKGKIAESDAEIYEYGYTLMVEKLMIFVISVAIALLLDAVWEVIALCITFIPLRVYSGGYHVKSRWGCMVMSGVFLMLGVLGAKKIEKFITIRCFVIIKLVCGMFLIRYAPMDVEQKKISNSELIYFKKKVVLVIVYEMFLGLLFHCLQKNIYVAIILISNITIVCSIIGEMIKKYFD